MRFLKILGMAFGILLCIAMAGAALRFLDFEVRSVLLDKGDVLKSWFYSPLFYIHVAGGAIAILAGPSQFFKGLRRRHISLHRLIGKIYIIACLLSGLSGLLISPFASTGTIAAVGFALLACAWLITTSLAYRSIRMGDIQAHGAWMRRSFALTFSAVTLRFWLGLFMAGMQMDFTEAYPIVAWLGWVPNLLFIEWVIRRMQKQRTPVFSEVVSNS